MTPRDIVQNWLAAVGLRLAQQPWSLSEYGVCELQTDHLRVSIEMQEEDGILGVAVELGDAPKDNRLQWMQTMLEANCLGVGTGGASLAIHPVTDRISLGITLPVDLLNENQFEQLLAGLLDQAANWQEYVSSLYENHLVAN